MGTQPLVLSYYLWHCNVSLFSLGERQTRSDLVEVFKVAKITHTVVNIYKIKCWHQNPWTLAEKLARHRFHLEIRRHFFCERVINRRNSLEEDTVSVTLVNAFKLTLEKRKKSQDGFVFGLTTSAGPRSCLQHLGGRTCKLLVSYSIYISS